MVIKASIINQVKYLAECLTLFMLIFIFSGCIQEARAADYTYVGGGRSVCSGSDCGYYNAEKDRRESEAQRVKEERYQERASRDRQERIQDLKERTR